MKTWFSTDGYERIRLSSLKHNKRVNRTIHLLVAEAFLKGGKYVNDLLQVNHIDGIKANNNVTNLELVTQTENVNHAHEHDLYTYNLKLVLTDKKDNTERLFRSLRELCRFLKVSLNYIRPRIIISNTHLIQNRYVINIDYQNYLHHVSTIKNNKKIFVYSHITNKTYTLTSYVQISILFGISYINVGKALNKYKDIQHYIGGYTFSLNSLDVVKKIISKEQALKDRNIIWLKLATSV